MKRILALLLTLLTMVGLLTACDCSHEYDSTTDLHCNACDFNRLEGTWTTTIEGEPGELTLHSDGTGLVVSHNASRECVWKVTDNTLSVVQEINGFTYAFLDGATFSIEEDTMTVTSQKGNTLVFEKK